MNHGDFIDFNGIESGYNGIYNIISPTYVWLVVEPYPSEKYFCHESVGTMTFPIYGKRKVMFQTTNQIYDSVLSENDRMI